MLFRKKVKIKGEYYKEGEEIEVCTSNYSKLSGALHIKSNGIIYVGWTCININTITRVRRK